MVGVRSAVRVMNQNMILLGVKIDTTGVDPLTHSHCYEEARTVRRHNLNYVRWVEAIVIIRVDP